MPQIARCPNHLYRKGSIYYFRHVIPHDLRNSLGRSEIRISLQTGYLAEARPKARILALGVKQILTKMRNGELPMDDFDQIKVFMNDWLRRLLKENEHISINNLTTPSPHTQYVPGDTEKMIDLLKDLMVSKDYDTMRNCMIIAAQDGTFGPPDSLPLSDEFAHEFTKALITYYRIISHRAEGDYAFEKTILPPEPVAPQPTHEPKPKILLSEALKRYKADKIASKRWSEGSAKDIMSTLNSLTDILGDIPVDEVDRQAVRHVRDTLLQLPRFRNSKRFKGKTIQEMVALEPDNTVAVSTVNNNLTNISSFLTWCEDEQIISHNPAHRLKIKEEKPETEHRSPYSDKDLKNIFNAPQYVEDTFLHPSDFWCPILSLFTGARREEVCQLHVEDVRQEDGVWVLDINKEKNVHGFANKKLKNPSAKRLLPLHPFLVETLHFPEFARQQAKNGHLRIFPELVKINTNYGHKLGERFGEFKKSIDLEEAEGVKDFHSLRHTFSNFFKQKKKQGDPFEQTFGHKLKKMSAERYGGRFPAAMCFDEVISHLDYGVDLSHLAKSKYVPK
jgi:integrase